MRKPWRRRFTLIESRLNSLERQIDGLGELELKVGIAALNSRMLDLEYRVKEYPTKDATLEGIRELERTIADPASSKSTWPSNPREKAIDDLESLLKYAHGRGWLSTVDWDAVRGK